MTVLPLGAWSPALITAYYHGERAAYLVLTAIVAVLGALTLDDSHTTDEHHEEHAA